MISCILLILTVQNPVEQFNQGNALYNESNYVDATEMYEAALLSVQHPALYYNLGNAYFKHGRMGKAILNYQRALFLSPRDQDIKTNLQFVRTYRVDKIRIQESPFTIMLRRLFRLVSMIEAQIIATVFFMIVMGFVSAFIVTRRLWLGYCGFGVFILFLFFGFTWIVWSNTLHGHNAVVVIPEVNALSGPGNDYKQILLLHDGAEVRIRETRGDFALIQLPGGMGGWVPLTSVEEIY
jgi:tetratricopeptide (TPR) repeat protein